MTEDLLSYFVLYFLNVSFNICVIYYVVNSTELEYQLAHAADSSNMLTRQLCPDLRGDFGAFYRTVLKDCDLHLIVIQ